MMKEKIRQYFKLTKFTLSFLVVFSSVMSYLMVENIIFSWVMILALGIGGFLITISANTLNQILEIDTDALMQRTAKRPLVSKKMSILEAQIFAFITVVLGSCILTYYFNYTTTLLSLLSLSLYAWVYTPSKKINSLAVFIGAIPGALPCLIGWVAGSPISIIGGWVLFLIQFFWQFPHFWAIAWLSHKDYTNAGFKLLPSIKGPTKYAALQSVLFSLLLIPIGFLPFLINMCTWIGSSIIFFANIFILIQSILLYKQMSPQAAKRVMFSSYLYLPIIYFALYYNKVN